MSLGFGLAIYMMVWWITLFAVLPFGVKTQAEDGAVVPGTPESAPQRFQWRKVFLVNTLVATLAFGLVVMALENNWLGSQMPLPPVPPTVTP